LEAVVRGMKEVQFQGISVSLIKYIWISVGVLININDWSQFTIICKINNYPPMKNIIIVIQINVFHFNYITLTKCHMQICNKFYTWKVSIIWRKERFFFII
jgi:hypothetical protein